MNCLWFVPPLLISGHSCPFESTPGGHRPGILSGAWVGEVLFRILDVNIMTTYEYFASIIVKIIAVVAVTVVEVTAVLVLRCH